MTQYSNSNTVLYNHKDKENKTSRKDLEKAGIMRINSYNKFFTKVAEIMNTSIKDVKPLDGGYKVELANHVYLNVYRGVDGSLVIHDHWGIAHVASCYDFKDFKTMKDLYDRLVLVYGESAKKEVMEVKQELNSRFGKELQYFDTDSLQPKIENINHCPKQNTCCIVSPFVHCDYNYKSDACIKVHKNFNHYCEQVYKQLKAKHNPEWHHVNLETLRNIDFNMIDKKRRLYMKVYRMTVNVTNTIYKCNRFSSIDNLRTNLLQTVRNMAKNGMIEWALVKYVKAKLDNCYLVKGLSSSIMSKTYNYNDSRSYTKTFIF